MDKAELRAKNDIKVHIRNGQKEEAKLLTREIIKLRKAKERLHISKTKVNSVFLKLGDNIGKQ